MRKSDQERDSYRPRSGRDWHSANARTLESDSYASDRGFDSDYDHSETQHFDRGYPSEHDREVSRGHNTDYGMGDSSRVVSGRALEPGHRFERNDRDAMSDRPSRYNGLRSNNNRSYDFERSGRSDRSNNALYSSGLSGQNSWGGSDHADDMRFDSDRSQSRPYAGRERFGTDRTNGRGYYDTSYGTTGMYGSNSGASSFSQSADTDRYGAGMGGDYSRTASDRMEGRGHFGKGPKGWKRSDDRIKEEVCEALYRAHNVDASDIDVMVKDGNVSLSGTVDSRESKRAAEMVVERLSGVDDVTNEIKVRKNEGLIGKGQTYVQTDEKTTGSTKNSKLS